MKEKARELLAQETQNIKKRQASLLQRTAEELNIEVDPDNITKINGKVQPYARNTFRPTLK